MKRGKFIRATREARRRAIECIAPRWVWSYNVPGHEGKPRRIEYELFRELKQRKAGDRISMSAAAPGIGSITYVITKITRNGVLGYAEHDNTRILTASETI